jgi:hypothetical protein
MCDCNSTLKSDQIEDGGIAFQATARTSPGFPQTHPRDMKSAQVYSLDPRIVEAVHTAPLTLLIYLEIFAAIGLSSALLAVLAVVLVEVAEAVELAQFLALLSRLARMARPALETVAQTATAASLIQMARTTEPAPLR